MTMQFTPPRTAAHAALTAITALTALAARAALWLGALAAAWAAPAVAQVRPTPIATGLEHPWALAFLPDGRMLVTERVGRMRIGWKGNAFLGALKARLLVRLELDGQRVLRGHRLLQSLGERIRDVRQGPDGLLYLLTDSDVGRIIRLDPEP